MEHLYVLFSIDLDRPAEGLVPGEHTLHDLLETAKTGLPYNFRYEQSAEVKRRAVQVPEGA